MKLSKSSQLYRFLERHVDPWDLDTENTNACTLLKQFSFSVLEFSSAVAIVVVSCFSIINAIWFLLFGRFELIDGSVFMLMSIGFGCIVLLAVSINLTGNAAEFILNWLVARANSDEALIRQCEEDRKKVLKLLNRSEKFSFIRALKERYVDKVCTKIELVD